MVCDWRHFFPRQISFATGVLILALFAVVTASCDFLGLGNEPIFTAVDADDPLTPAQKERLAELKADDAYESVQLVHVHDLERIKDAVVLQIPISPEKTLSTTRENLELREDESFTWYGDVENGGRVFLRVSRNYEWRTFHLFGSLEVYGKTFRVQQLAGDIFCVCGIAERFFEPGTIYDLSIKVTEVDDPQKILNGNIEVGDELRGSLRAEFHAASDNNPDPGVWEYRLTDPSNSFVIRTKDGTLTFRTDTEHPELSLTLVDGGENTGGDSLLFESRDNQFPFVVEESTLSWTFIDPSGRAMNNCGGPCLGIASQEYTSSREEKEGIVISGRSAQGAFTIVADVTRAGIIIVN